METVEPRVAEAQQFVLELWRRLLERPDQSLDDNFFACGDRSIHMKASLDALERHFHVRLTLEDLVEHPTARALAQRASGRDGVLL
jgi:hypothetical protein